MPRRQWEYRLLESSDAEQLLRALAQLGDDGWEAVSYQHRLAGAADEAHMVLLKRPKYT